MRIPLIPSELKDFAQVFRRAGRQCYIVGGAVRDGLIGRLVADYDAATDAPPEEVMRLFRRVVPTGIKHGTVTVLWKGRNIETTTFRRDLGYSDGRRPDKVEFGASLEEDLARRDFTINAMALDPLESRIIDPHGGQADLERRLVRAVGDPVLRFAEDGLRPLRAVRFATQLGFEIEAATFAAVNGALSRLKAVSAERLREEIEKILMASEPSRGLRLMEESGMLAIVLPELTACRGVEQRGLHRFDVLDHLYVSLDASPRDREIRLAALFHDIGKPGTRRREDDGVFTFHRHEELSARLAEGILKRLRFPNAVIDEVTHLIRQHMFFYDESWSDAAVRRFLARVGTDHVDKLLALRLADSTGILGHPADPRSIEPLRRRIDAVIAKDEALGLKDLAIGGSELAALGVPRGPVMGRILAELLETVLDDPEQNTKEQLLRIARGIMPKYGL